MFRRPVSEFSLLLCLLFASPLTPAGVWEELSASGRCDSYRPMAEEQLRLAESLFREILQMIQVSDEWLASAWSQLGYAPVPVAAAGDDWVGLQDVTPACRGQGLYLINRRPKGALVVQAPHAYHDLHSGQIAGSLLREDVAILAWNSAKRSVRIEAGGALADLAKRRDSLFIALARALARAPQGRLIQIHGFDNRKRRTNAGTTAAVIVSSGSRWSTPPVEHIAGCLRPIIEGPVLVYPREVAELGATRNAQGHAVRSHGHQGFVHLELNRRTRERLRSAPAPLAGCLGIGLN